ncbi:Maf family protein [Alkalihalobacillus sp. 1P02AB]|uniref:Maf family protein n=1 Tax=Alkalihalobacillus sp. 1P02AB TaxID=3132260 RepID=UPI0039A4239A
MIPFILASSSPRRQELLKQVNYSFEIITKDTSEQVEENLLPEKLVLQLANRKAEAVFVDHPDKIVLGADTIVAKAGSILGKPESKEEAFQMLKLLSGSKHSVYTGVTILSRDQTQHFYQQTDVEMYELTDDEIMRYLNSGEPIGKAGSYAIQGLGAYLVKEIKGDYNNVVGLPLAKVMRALAAYSIFPENKKLNSWKE